MKNKNMRDPSPHMEQHRPFSEHDACWAPTPPLPTPPSGGQGTKGPPDNRTCGGGGGSLGGSKPSCDGQGATPRWGWGGGVGHVPRARPDTYPQPLRHNQDKRNYFMG